MVAVVVPALYRVSRTDVGVSASRAIQRLLNSVRRAVWEPSVELEYRSYGPATNDLLKPRVVAVEEYRLPNAEELERLSNVEVGRSIRVPDALRSIGVLVVRSRPIRVQALRPLELCLGREVMHD